MHNLARLLSVAGRFSGVVALALAIGAGPAVSAAGPPGLPKGVHGPTVYGQVVDVGTHAIVLQLSNGNWAALNVTSQTVIVPPSGSNASLSSIQDNDWVLATYSVVHGSGSGARWFVAGWMTFSTSALAIGQSSHLVGTVGAILPNGSFTLQAADGSQWVVTLTSQTVVRLGNVVSTLSFLQPHDRVQVWGSAAGHTVVATRIVYQVAKNASTGAGDNTNGGNNGGDTANGGGGHGRHPHRRPHGDATLA